MIELLRLDGYVPPVDDGSEPAHVAPRGRILSKTREGSKWSASFFTFSERAFMLFDSGAALEGGEPAVVTLSMDLIADVGTTCEISLDNEQHCRIPALAIELQGPVLRLGRHVAPSSMLLLGGPYPEALTRLAECFRFGRDGGTFEKLRRENAQSSCWSHSVSGLKAVPGLVQENLAAYLSSGHILTRTAPVNLLHSLEWANNMPTVDGAVRPSFTGTGNGASSTPNIVNAEHGLAFRDTFLVCGGTDTVHGTICCMDGERQTYRLMQLSAAITCATLVAKVVRLVVANRRKGKVLLHMILNYMRNNIGGGDLHRSTTMLLATQIQIRWGEDTSPSNTLPNDELRLIGGFCRSFPDVASARHAVMHMNTLAALPLEQLLEPYEGIYYNTITAAGALGLGSFPTLTPKPPVYDAASDTAVAVAASSEMPTSISRTLTVSDGEATSTANPTVLAATVPNTDCLPQLPNPQTAMAWQREFHISLRCRNIRRVSSVSANNGGSAPTSAGGKLQALVMIRQAKLKPKVAAVSRQQRSGSAPMVQKWQRGRASSTGVIGSGDAGRPPLPTPSSRSLDSGNASVSPFLPWVQIGQTDLVKMDTTALLRFSTLTRVALCGVDRPSSGEIEIGFQVLHVAATARPEADAKKKTGFFFVP
jgi:hypothetical protein